MKNLWLLLVLFASVATLQAQDKGISGFIITTEGAKKYGKLQLGTPAVNSLKIQFKNEEGVKKTYRPFDIAAWGSEEDGSMYVSKAYSPGNSGNAYGVFMRQMTNGKGFVQCYEYWNTDGMNGFSQLYLEKSGELTEVRMGKFKKQMSEYFAESEEIVQKINDGAYKKNLDGLLEIIMDYNDFKESEWD